MFHDVDAELIYYNILFTDFVSQNKQANHGKHNG
jgi:hypothetical protein